MRGGDGKESTTLQFLCFNAYYVSELSIRGNEKVSPRIFEILVTTFISLQVKTTFIQHIPSTVLNNRTIR